MTIERKLLGTTPVSGEVLPEAVSFDGATDKLRKASDLTGNADGKMLTFSTWFYSDGSTTNTRQVIIIGSFVVNLPTDGSLHLRGYSSGGYGAGPAFYVNWLTNFIPQNQWNHLLVSIDVTGANTAKRHVYLNDVNINTTAAGLDVWDSWNDRLIEFTKSSFHYIGGIASNTQNIKGRLAHVFLDYTYRDLSTTSNRRLFIDADGKPSSTIPSSPILYLPMTDAATAGSNSGTGGDFTVNGVLATAERGPNQDNCSASVFDGANDYLNKAITTSSNNKTMTFSCILNTASVDNDDILFSAFDGTYTTVECSLSSGNRSIYFNVRNSSGVQVLKAGWSIDWEEVQNRNNHICISFDLSDTSKRHLYVNGVEAAGAYYAYIDSVIPSSLTTYVGRYTAANKYLLGTIGEVYLDDSYTDLATSNPFWDSDTNRPNSVRKVIEDTGVTPLIALPIIGNDAGNNLGSGGDFTVNSGPYTGARGGSEFWSRSANLGDTSTAKTFKKNLGISTKILTIVFASKPTAASMKYICSTPAGAPYTWFMINTVGTNFITIEGQNSTRKVLDSTTASSGSQVNNEWNINFISFDLSDTSKRIHWLQNSAVNNEVPRNYGTYIDDVINLSSNDFVIGENEREGAHFSGDFGFTYVSTTFIDFSQEANRNKFVDQLGYPRDLTQQIEDGDIPNPLIYMKFDDTAALGTNSGTAGNLTVTGAPAAGSDFTP